MNRIAVLVPDNQIPSLHRNCEITNELTYNYSPV